MKRSFFPGLVSRNGWIGDISVMLLGKECEVELWNLLLLLLFSWYFAQISNVMKNHKDSSPACDIEWKQWKQYNGGFPGITLNTSVALARYITGIVVWRLVAVTCSYYVLHMLDEDGLLDISHCISTTSFYHVSKHPSKRLKLAGLIIATTLLINFGKWGIINPLEEDHLEVM